MGKRLRLRTGVALFRANWLMLPIFEPSGGVRNGCAASIGSAVMMRLSRLDKGDFGPHAVVVADELQAGAGCCRWPVSFWRAC